jgi:integrase
MGMSVRVSKNRHNRLYFRLYWQGMDIREGTKLVDSPENRRLAEAKARVWSDQIDRGTFDYLREFPNGNKARLFRTQLTATAPKTIRQWYEAWIDRYLPPMAKRSRYRNYKSHFETHILPVHGDRQLSQYGVAEIRELLTVLVQRKQLSVKTAKNALNGSLRSMFRDAVSEGLLESNPFSMLPPRWWPASPKPQPDPFEESERDEILNYFREKHGTTWRAAYVFLYTLFWTGARPSELTARRWSDLDLRTGKLQIATGRTAGEEGELKTFGSNRTIKLFPQVIELIKEIQPLRAQPTDYIFSTPAGKPIDQSWFGHRFQAALRALGLRHRDFYKTRATFISVLLTHGENPKQIADYCGNSPAMIWKSYARWIKDEGTFGKSAVEAAKITSQNKQTGN